MSNKWHPPMAEGQDPEKFYPKNTDDITIKRIDLMHPVLREVTHKTYIEMCEALTGKATVRFAYTLRTFAEQDALYSIGRTKLYDETGKRLGKVTNAKAGQSFHNYGLAFDIVLLTGKTASWDTIKDFDGDGEADWMECVTQHTHMCNHMIRYYP